MGWVAAYVFVSVVAARASDIAGAKIDPSVRVAFPPSGVVVDITRPPYSAKGDGVTDDTAAIQRAVLDYGFELWIPRSKTEDAELC